LQVETFFVDNIQQLYPFYHIAYWLGLTSNEGAYPMFRWLDYNTAGPGIQGTYTNWGVGNGFKEPRRRQMCGVGNYSVTTGGVWGWADRDCNMAHIFICEIKRGWRRKLW
jgi:hypothetical protein